MNLKIVFTVIVLKNIEIISALTSELSYCFSLKFSSDRIKIIYFCISFKA